MGFNPGTHATALCFFRPEGPNRASKQSRGAAALHQHQPTLYVGDNSRNRLIVPGITDNAKSTSVSVFCFPKLKRILARARSGGRPIAVSTCDGSIAPEEQAAPVETASPFRSRAITIASPSM